MEPIIDNTSKETVSGKEFVKIDDRNFKEVTTSVKEIAINVDELLDIRARHVQIISEIDLKLSQAGEKGVDITEK